jgi:ribosomal protein S18 acetylase RimI-like enzyme
MPIIRKTKDLPGNFPVFIREAASGIEKIYGPEAARNYMESAEESIQSSLNSGALRAFVSEEGGVAVGVLFAYERDGIGNVSFIHVPRGFAGRGVEDGLLRECVKTFREERVDGVLSEIVELCKLDLEDTYRELGFTRAPRALMKAPLDASGLQSDVISSVNLDADRFEEAADAILDAYKNHPNRILHVDVRKKDAALAFIHRVADGEQGPVRSEYLRAALRDDKIAAVIFGCEAAPGCGFILQLATRREHQHQGIGPALMRDLVEEFRQAGYVHVALGATLGGPAHKLYLRLGFREIWPVDAYVRIFARDMFG